MKKEYALISVAGAAIGILAVILVKLGNPPNMGFCIACFERDIAGALGLHQPWAAAWIRPEILGIVLGAFLAALFTKDFRPTGGSAPLTRFILAVFVMIGALCFLGCPLRMTLRLGGGDLNALVAFGGFFVGIAVGAYFLKDSFNLGRAQKQKSTDGFLVPVIFLALLLLVIFLPQFKEGGAIFVGSGGHPGTGKDPVVSVGLGIVFSLIAGLIVGILAQRTSLCLAGGIRDLILIRDKYLVTGLLSILIFTIIGNIIVGKFHLGFENQPIAHTRHLWNFFGMSLVGLGSTLLGGCPLRQLVLSGSGNTDSAVTVVGMVVGAAIVHNFGLASGATFWGKSAVILGLVVAICIGYLNREKLA